MKFAKYLAGLGYGSRREVLHLFAHGRITHEDGTPYNSDDPFTHDDVRVDDEPLDAPPSSVVMLHKPVGYVCSTKEASRLVYELLPARFRDRNPIMAPVGRLDKETSGLLLFTDDGQFNHRLTSPRSHVAKRYEATLASPVTGTEAEVFASGTMLLDGETEPLAPVEMRMLYETRVELTLHEGRYHQVRRMFAAVGNHVVSLHRTALGTLTLGDLPSGEWRVLTTEEKQSLVARPPTLSDAR